MFQRSRSQDQSAEAEEVVEEPSLYFEHPMRNTFGDMPHVNYAFLDLIVLIVTVSEPV